MPTTGCLRLALYREDANAASSRHLTRGGWRGCCPTISVTLGLLVGRYSCTAPLLGSSASWQLLSPLVLARWRTPGVAALADAWRGGDEMAVAVLAFMASRFVQRFARGSFVRKYRKTLSSAGYFLCLPLPATPLAHALRAWNMLISCHRRLCGRTADMLLSGVATCGCVCRMLVDVASMDGARRTVNLSA